VHHWNGETRNGISVKIIGNRNRKPEKENGKQEPVKGNRKRKTRKQEKKTEKAFYFRFSRSVWTTSGPSRTNISPTR
jgi:hypothetical protein